MSISLVSEQWSLAWTNRAIGVMLAIDSSARRSIMPSPFAPPIVLDADESTHLQTLVRAHSSPQALVFRCRLILRLAAADQPSNLQAANELHCARNTVVL